MPVSTIFGQPASPATLTQDTTAYTMGVQFSVSQAGTLAALWFYSAPGAVSRPSAIALYAVSGQVLVHSETAAWSGAAGSGWIRAAFASPPSLSAGTAYKAVVGNFDGNWFYAGTAHYWDTGPGGSGVTSGVITAPASGSADGGQDTFVVGSTLTYPGSSFNANNYWVDVEVVTGSTVSGSAAFTAHGTLTAAAKNTVTAAAHFAAPALLSAAGVIARPGVTHLTAASSVTAGAKVTAQARAALSAPGALGSAGSVIRLVRAQAVFSAQAALTALVITGIDLAGLWAAYQAAQATSASAWRDWRMMRSVAATDGTAGFLYLKAYEAQQLTDGAYEAYAAAHRLVYPGARG